MFAYIAIPIHLLFIFGSKLLLRSKQVDLLSMDLYTGRITAEDKERAEMADREQLEAIGSDVSFIDRFRALVKRYGAH